MREVKLLLRMVERDLRSKYVGSLIGVFWTVIHPLLLLLVFTFIFAIVFKARFGPERREDGTLLDQDPNQFGRHRLQFVKLQLHERTLVREFKPDHQ